jgi:hypothetical protein
MADTRGVIVTWLQCQFNVSIEERSTALSDEFMRRVPSTNPSWWQGDGIRDIGMINAAGVLSPSPRQNLPVFQPLSGHVRTCETHDKR